MAKVTHAPVLLLLLALSLPLLSSAFNGRPDVCNTKEPDTKYFDCGQVVATEKGLNLKGCVKYCMMMGGAMYYTFQDSTPTKCICRSEGKPSCGAYVETGKRIFYNGAQSACFNSDGLDESLFEGDPHFVGADGVHFDFNGELGQSFCLVSDERIHVNGFFDGYVVKSNHKLRTWIKDMSLTWRDSTGDVHQVVLQSRRGKATTRGTQGLLVGVTADGMPLDIPREVGKQVTTHGGFHLALKSNSSKIKGGMDRDTFLVTIDGLLSAELSLNAEMAYLQTPEDAHVHINLKINGLQVSSNVHGVLGQTFRRQAVASQAIQLLASTKKAGPAGAVEGAPADYKTTGLTKPNCRFAHKAWTSEA